MDFFTAAPVSPALLGPVCSSGHYSWQGIKEAENTHTQELHLEKLAQNPGKLAFLSGIRLQNIKNHGPEEKEHLYGFYPIFAHFQAFFIFIFYL